MKINANIKYFESYLPTKRHRIPRLREVEETVGIELREVQKSDAKLAMTVTDYQSYLDSEGKDHFGSMDMDLYAVGQDLFTEKRDRQGALDKGEYPLDRFLVDVQDYGMHRVRRTSDADLTKDYVLQELKKFLNAHLVIDGKVYVRSKEPRYVVNPFGLGHNHGGTGMFIEYHYNPNIRKDHYFNALQREEAIAYANRIAEARGDTESVGKFGKHCNIKVYMPEMVRCHPQVEHGDGNPFLNSLESLIQVSSSQAEAGILVMAETAAPIADGKRPSLEDQIQDASTKASHVDSDPKSKEYTFCPHDYEKVKNALLDSGENSMEWANDGYACRLEKDEHGDIYYDVHLSKTGTTIMYGETIEVLSMDEHHVTIRVPNDENEMATLSKTFFEQNFVPYLVQV